MCGGVGRRCQLVRGCYKLVRASVCFRGESYQILSLCGDRTIGSGD